MCLVASVYFTVQLRIMYIVMDSFLIIHIIDDIFVKLDAYGRKKGKDVIRRLEARPDQSSKERPQILKS